MSVILPLISLVTIFFNPSKIHSPKQEFFKELNCAGSFLENMFIGNFLVNNLLSKILSISNIFRELLQNLWSFKIVKRPLVLVYGIS